MIFPAIVSHESVIPDAFFSFGIHFLGIQVLVSARGVSRPPEGTHPSIAAGVAVLEGHPSWLEMSFLMACLKMPSS